jgi:choline dehydrogenase-like flavoprotein
MPDPDSRIDLCETTDRFGNPLPRLTWRIGQTEMESVRYFHKQLALRLEADGLGRLTTDPEDIDASMFSDSSHHMGSTRMAAAADKGVVDGDLRVHGLQDLFLCSSSVFPTAGSVNPTWTLVALALRLADHLKAVAAKT